QCGAPVYEHGSHYVCSHTVPTPAQPAATCDFKSGTVILQQPVEREQMQKLLSTGKTDLLDKFVSLRTRRAFKAFLVWDKAAGKVNFEFEPRQSKYPPKAGAAAAEKTGKTAPAKKTPAKKAAKTTAKVAKAPRALAPGKPPSAALAEVIGTDPVPHTEVIKKIWAYVHAHNLQDATNKRAINADAKLLAVFGKPQITMFELAGIVGKHLG
ncbi:MAG: topoisomerase C-terminal repeat-containing protein, partial [Burkholderiaceae bacterium]|nr:topoisomerase C-terminal repeat-containing protein [Burkholderiaceae bacterium]